MGTLMNLFHLTAFSAYSFTLYQAFFNMDIPLLAHRFKKFDPGQLKYLTIWGVIAQTVFFFLCILNDLYGSNKVIPKRTPALRRIKDYFHAAFGFPLAMFVGVVFWSLMFVDRELVLPKALDPYFPWWLNHLMHTMVVVSTVIEMLVAPRQYPKRSYGFGGLALVMLSYLVWIHFIYYKSGIWVYPVMEVLSLPMRIVFLLALLFFCSLLYLAGEGFDHLLWGTIKRTSSKTSKKKKTK
ncbi:androgen-dependent TFPI-regulating protein-like isoform X2 [Fopius arisanus]|uniref:Androgen-dependent TFPI-regulating protein-like isoform X2 n=1 Tax=Fopius arisanus TaxID=64838 RepID=A0A9R1T8D6_9HYME|nr:PREDICTED: androgen-dependent TFPI-regulating protein-like isoform X2 [Fopius arisanus]XP_011304582.1 PREDICTED: androgen-dependent TFPI-regulating protein-like isoform X2 [Fopius arisanus]XP_011304583.1 PREDICTED: androgen-dependent TFPI-regulating protein-like isoform X2 [Fopius arisanus]